MSFRTEAVPTGIAPTVKLYVNTNDNCNICLEPLSEQQDSLVRAACNHIYHETCFNQWRMTPKAYNDLRQKECTICRGPLDTSLFIKPSPEEDTDPTPPRRGTYLEVPEQYRMCLDQHIK